MLKYLLDTNIVIYTMKNRPEAVRKQFKKHEGQMAISSVTLGGLVFGAENSQHVEFAARLEVLTFDNKAAYHFGQIRSELYKSGRPIGPYDMMIAGHARSAGLILVTNNMKEFKRVPGLMTENWAKQ